MINAGAILVCALLKTMVGPEMSLAEKFDFTMNYFEVNLYKFVTIYMGIFNGCFFLFYRS